MENAVAELMQENNGGLLVWFFEILWSQARKDEKEPEPKYLADFPSIPHSVLFNYSHAQGWFFEPTVLRSSVLRRIRRKRRIHLVAHDIFEELSAVSYENESVGKKRSSTSSGEQDYSNTTAGGGAEAGEAAQRRTIPEEHEIVAQLITRQSLKAIMPRITYLTYSGLEELLFRGTIAEGSVLQKFVLPQGPRAQQLDNCNVCLSVLWQPSYCYVERYVNKYALSDRTRSAHERGVTVEDLKHSSCVALAHKATTLHRCTQAINAIASHVFAVTGLNLRSVTCIMKIDNRNRLVLLYVQRVAVVENQRLVPNLVSGELSSDDEVDAVPTAQQELDLQLRRCKSDRQRQLLVSLLPEHVADDKFDTMAPRSWTKNSTRNVLRFAAVKRANSAMSSGSSSNLRGRTTSLGSSSFSPLLLKEDTTVEGATSELFSPTRSVMKSGIKFLTDDGNTLGATGATTAPSPLWKSVTKAGDTDHTATVRTTGSLRSTRGASVVLNAEREAIAKTEASIIISQWSDTPSRMDTALTRDATTDLYPMKKVAHSVASLGLREKYLASMRAASVGKPFAHVL